MWAWLLGVPLLITLAIAFAPASVLDRLMAQRTAGTIRLAESEGTVWRGNAILTGARGEPRVPVAWSLDFPPLLRGEIQLRLTRPLPGGPNGSIDISGGALSLTNLRTRLPANSLQGRMLAGGMVALGGDVMLDVPQLRWDGTVGSGMADVRWEGARLAMNALAVELGTVLLHISPEGPSFNGVLRNEGGDVKVDGTIVWSPASLVVDAQLRPTDSAPPWARVALAMLGQPDAQGAVHVSWRATP